MRQSDNEKFCFIINYNDEILLNKCIDHINDIVIPEGYDIDLLTVSEAESMASGYEEARLASDAKYKIYIHQDVFISNTNILNDILSIFNDEKIAAIGVMGSKDILGNTFSLASEVVGKCITVNSKKIYSSSRFIKNTIGKKNNEVYTEVGCLFGCFIATQTDFEWKTIFENDWKYYSVIHSLEIQKNGYKMVVPNQSEPWCIHDGNNDGLNFSKTTLETLKTEYGSLIKDSYFKRVLIVDTEEIAFPAMELSLLRQGYKAEVYNENVSSIRCEEELSLRMAEWMKGNDYLFSFTFDYSPNVGEAAEQSNTKYISWAWDSPLLQYAFSQAKYPTTYALMFDRGEIEDLKNLGLKNVIHMPLVTDNDTSTRLVISASDERKYSHDISFVGKMYDTDIIKEYKSSYDDESIKTLDLIIKEDLCDWTNPKKIYDDLNNCLMDSYYKNRDKIEIPYYYEKYFLCSFFSNIAYLERVKILNSLAEKFKVDLYTKGDIRELRNVIIHDPINSVAEAPKVYHLSKINLNITNHSIKTGVPLRIFEIIGVGGFVISNYQEEIVELFEEDREIVVFRTVEELVEKVAYYLKHDKQRMKIALSGYNKVKKLYNYDVAVNEILKKCQIDI